MEHGESSAPQLIRDFSREQSPEAYKQTVQAIKDKRQEFHQQRKARTEKQNNLQETTTEQEQTLNETLTGLNNLRDRVDELSTSKFKKLISYFRLRKIRADIEVGERSYEELKQQQELTTNQQQETAEQLKTPPELQEAKDILSSFYKDQKEKWAKSEYSKEEIKKLFTEEHLSSLSIQDYILLLKRFPSEMVAHVTRQGIRDHVGMSDHDVGVGKYFDGFMKITKDGRLRSPLGVYLIENEKEAAIFRFLKLDSIPNKEEALQALSVLTTTEGQGLAGTYSNRMAIHFATEEVANTCYGSERGNEIFFVYPSAFIASQYYFAGQLNESGNGYHNDQFVWANEEHGLDINAGLVFIPKETMVDRQTGSRYQLDENNKPIINSDYYSAFKRVFESDGFNDFAEQVTESISNLNQDIDFPKLSIKNQELVNKLEPFRQKLEQEFGIKDRRLQNAIFTHRGLNSLLDIKIYGEDFYNNVDAIIQKALADKGILFLESQDTITSQDFWENYFNKNPQQHPSKIVYYKGNDPTFALQQWKEENGLRKTTKDEDIGFTEQRISKNDPHATIGIDRFKSLAEKVIEDYYSQKKDIVA